MRICPSSLLAPFMICLASTLLPLHCSNPLLSLPASFLLPAMLTCSSRNSTLQAAVYLVWLYPSKLCSGTHSLMDFGIKVMIIMMLIMIAIIIIIIKTITMIIMTMIMMMIKIIILKMPCMPILSVELCCHAVCSTMMLRASGLLRLSSSWTLCTKPQ